LSANWRKWVLAILFVGAVVLAVLHWGDVKQFAKLVAHAQPLWLLAALAAQIATYFSLSAEWALVLRAGNCPRSIFRLVPLSIVKLFVDNVVPTSGMSGHVVLVDRLAAIGVKRKIAVAAVILSIVAYYASYAVSAICAAFLLWLHDDLSAIIAAGVGIFLCIAAAIPSGTLWLQGKGRDAMPRCLRKSEHATDFFKLVGEAPAELVHSKTLIAELTLLNGFVFVLDALTMQFCLFSLGMTAPFGAVFAAFMVASIVMTLGPVPLGLGSFEGSSIAMLRLMGVSFEAALSATLLFRGFSLWLPLAGGMILARRELKHSS
jgi:glycosyltransferase 2 family protein